MLVRQKYEYRKQYYENDAHLRQWIDNIEVKSPTSADVALRRIGYVCRVFKIELKDLRRMSSAEGHSLILKLVRKLRDEGKTPGYINNYVTVIKSFFEHLGKPISQKVRLPRSNELKQTKASTEMVPKPAELGRILDNSTIEQKVRITLMAFCGFRPETLGDFNGKDGLRIMDIPELEIDNGNRTVTFTQIPTMVVCRPSLSKAGHRYFSFYPEQGCTYLQELLEQRMCNGETLTKESFIVTSLKYYGKQNSDYKGGAISTNKISASIRKAIRRTGFNFRPYVLRSYFDMRLMAAEADALLLRDYRIFFMGHKGDIEHQYTTNKEGISDDIKKQMREKYAKSASKQLVTTSYQNGDTQDLVTAQFNSLMLQAADFSEQEINELGDLSSLDPKELSKMLDDKGRSKLGLKNGNCQKVVSMNEVEKYIEDGWEYVTTLPNSKAVVKLPSSDK